MVAFLFIAAAASLVAPVEPMPTGTAVGLSNSSSDCSPATTAEVVVCANPRQSYRIDKNVLDASREHDAPPRKPPARADLAQDNGCVGGKTCSGGVIPLVGMALVAAKAAALAANGEDWRDAIRTHEDEYRLYKEAEARTARERRPRIGFGIGR